MFTPPARAQRVRANGIEHHVLEWGAADAVETVVLCHGFLDNAFGFARLAPLLTDKRVLAIDFRGHGESGRIPPGGYYYFPDYVLDLHALLPQLVRAPFHLVGHSMGGTVCAYYGATHREELRSLTLLESTGPLSDDASNAPGRFTRWLAQASQPPAPAQLRDLDDAYTRLRARHVTTEEGFLRALAACSTMPHPSGQGLTWRFDPLHRTTGPIGFDAARFGACLAAIEARTLVLMAERGMRAPDHDARVAQIRHVESDQIADAGHMVHWTHPQEVAARLLRHFR